MSNPDFSGLKDIAKAGPTGPKGWEPLRAETLGYGTGLCLDQSLTATGMVIIQHVFPASAPTVIRSAKWSTEHEGKGVLTALRRGIDVYRMMKATLRDLPVPIDWVAHESPPNPSAMKNTDTSSLQASQALWCAMDELGLGEPEMIGSQPGKKLVCGNGNAKKPEAHKALKEDVLPWIVNSQVITNEAHRDALMVGLVKLARTPR